MSKTLIGMVTFGNFQFTQLAITSVEETTFMPYDMFVVVGKPGDTTTIEWLKAKGIPHTIHTSNKGFPYSLNDIYEYAWVTNDYDNLVIMGNDIVCFPYAVDALILEADTSDYEVISSLQLDVKSLVAGYPETAQYFEGSTYNFTDFSAKPWEVYLEFITEERIVADMRLYDIQNLCLYRRECFEKIGYTDVNFYPAYCVDNDYAMRIVKADIKCCSLVSARFFHFWSRTIHQGSGGSNSKYFQQNKRYYREKWGGNFGSETLTPDLKIATRDDEDNQLKKWIG